MLPVNQGPAEYVPDVLYPEVSECWSCGTSVPGDVTAAMRRCDDCDVTWKVEMVRDPVLSARLLAIMREQRSKLDSSVAELREKLARRAQGA